MPCSSHSAIIAPTSFLSPLCRELLTPTCLFCLPYSSLPHIPCPAFLTTLSLSHTPCLKLLLHSLPHLLYPISYPTILNPHSLYRLFGLQFLGRIPYPSFSQLFTCPFYSPSLHALTRPYLVHLTPLFLPALLTPHSLPHTPYPLLTSLSLPRT